MGSHIHPLLDVTTLLTVPVTTAAPVAARTAKVAAAAAPVAAKALDMMVNGVHAINVFLI